ncbi:hypothetical protein ACMDCR_02350 [Labrys okinawensis]|uniref:hypothetical protein n=1 Tax=Labrys okinawensis TaxID=346911 RepID=UPI0039BCB03E
MDEGLEMMTADRFAALAAAYGSELQNWPPLERVDGDQFATQAQGRAILAMARRLDIALGSIVERWGPTWSNSRQARQGAFERGGRKLVPAPPRGQSRKAHALPRGGDSHG